MYKTIDYKNWDRREIYEFYSSKRLPHYVVAANIDVTKLLEYKRRNGISFYLSLIYLATEALNSIENFHLRIVIKELKNSCSIVTPLLLKVLFVSM